jgi:hypothetical protein
MNHAPQPAEDPAQPVYKTGSVDVVLDGATRTALEGYATVEIAPFGTVSLGILETERIPDISKPHGTVAARRGIIQETGNTVDVFIGKPSIGRKALAFALGKEPKTPAEIRVANTNPGYPTVDQPSR